MTVYRQPQVQVGGHMLVGGDSHDASNHPILGDRPISVATRAAELVAGDAAATARAEEEKKNKNFYMVFKSGGSQALRALMKKSPVAAQLFLYFAENIDKSNAIIAAGRVLGEALKVHETAISRAIKVLVDDNYIVRLKSGSSNIIILNPDIVWSAWATGKNRCWFDNAKVLVSKSEQPESVRRQMAILLKKMDKNTPIEEPLFPDEVD